MGLFGKKKQIEAIPAESIACPHTVLLPRWDSVDDIGHEDRATSFVCEACEETFSPEEARMLRQSAAERLLEITAEAPAEAETR
jgi:hypothetical protein